MKQRQKDRDKQREEKEVTESQKVRHRQTHKETKRHVDRHISNFQRQSDKQVHDKWEPGKQSDTLVECKDIGYYLCICVLPDDNKHTQVIREVNKSG